MQRAEYQRKKKKFTFKCDDVQFIGHRLTEGGLKPDPAKVRAILGIKKKPDDVAAVQRLMGMVKYVSNSLVTYLRFVNLSGV